MLALPAGQPVPVAELIGAVWDGQPPRSARGSPQALVTGAAREAWQQVLREAWQQALAVVDDLHDPDAARVESRLDELRAVR